MVTAALLVVTGLVKALAHVVLTLPDGLMNVMFWVHDIAAALMLLFLAAHVFFAVIAPFSWKTFPSMLIGWMPRGEAEKEHAGWMERLERELQILLLPKDPNDGRNVFLEIRAGTGGDRHGVPLIINDHIDIALAVDADGVHVGQDDMPVADVRRLIGPDKWLGLSVTNAVQMAEVPYELVDYLGIGPVYPTGTKSDAAPVVGVSAFAELVAESRLPVVGIGGIQVGNCLPLVQAGAKGVAVVSAICGQEDPVRATKVLLERLKQVFG